MLHKHGLSHGVEKKRVHHLTTVDFRGLELKTAIGFIGPGLTQGDTMAHA